MLLMRPVFRSMKEKPLSSVLTAICPSCSMMSRAVLGFGDDAMEAILSVIIIIETLVGAHPQRALAVGVEGRHVLVATVLLVIPDDKL